SAHDPKLALVAEDDGSADLLTILETAPSHLCPSGLLAMETGESHHDLLAERATAAGYIDSRGLKDLAKRPRFFLARRAIG
ncbi:MAG: peptide chain release factor N(5)-glutamine methyltransferase, partial [Opitutales bacterium]